MSERNWGGLDGPLQCAQLDLTPSYQLPPTQPPLLGEADGEHVRLVVPSDARVM